jgi:transposase
VSDGATSAVVIGMDPHKRSVTIEVMAGEEMVLGGGRFATDAEGYRQMRAYVARWRRRVWAIEGCAGIGGWALILEASRDHTVDRRRRSVRP